MDFYLLTLLLIVLLEVPCLLIRSRLRQIPGPLIAKLTPARHLLKAWLGNLHVDVLECHARYGNVVQYGPNTFVFNTTKAFHEIYGHSQNFQKARGYDCEPVSRQHSSLFNTTSTAEAIQKRKTYKIAMSSSSLEVFEASCVQQTQTLMNRIDCNGRVHDISNLASWYALDVISQALYGTSVSLLSSSSEKWLPQSLMKANLYMYLRLAWPQLFSMCDRWFDVTRISYPDFHRDSHEFHRLTNELKNGNREGRACIRNLMMQDAQGNAKEIELEVETMLRAGADTVAITISSLFYYIFQDNTCYRTLVTEIRSNFRSRDDVTFASLSSTCPYLGRCVNEALRMNPPAPGLLLRQCLEDCVIDNIPVPRGSQVGVGVYALHHNEDYFPDPFKFKPDRFKDTAGRQDAFVPFLKGSRSCPAQRFAYAAILLPVAHILLGYNVSKEGNYGGGTDIGSPKNHNSAEVYQQTDMFTSGVRGPNASFVSRSR